MFRPRLATIAAPDADVPWQSHARAGGSNADHRGHPTRPPWALLAAHRLATPTGAQKVTSGVGQAYGPAQISRLTRSVAISLRSGRPKPRVRAISSAELIDPDGTTLASHPDISFKYQNVSVASAEMIAFQTFLDHNSLLNRDDAMPSPDRNVLELLSCG